MLSEITILVALLDHVRFILQNVVNNFFVGTCFFNYFVISQFHIIFISCHLQYSVLVFIDRPHFQHEEQLNDFDNFMENYFLSELLIFPVIQMHCYKTAFSNTQDTTVMWFIIKFPECCLVKLKFLNVLLQVFCIYQINQTKKIYFVWLYVSQKVPCFRCLWMHRKFMNVVILNICRVWHPRRIFLR